MGLQSNCAFDFTVQFFFMFKMDMIYIYIVSLSLGIKIHCGHLFLLQNVQTKQFIKFSLSAGDGETF